ncbi:ABC transporter permease [Protaetiibacter larvae]|uniref:Transport permease protein n=1 Tax=Protaetiibacter larvae TaxID=2592654 RepID=A0A5C1Y707_9MICO|nr:ABC transporter permease [Protaetiibacter larvae]QEO08682.1 ABC transporter permease [Protaetiibacter larvae]
MTTLEPLELAEEARRAAARVRRFGAWYAAEHQIRVWRRYLGVNIASAIGTPVLYLFAFGVGLGVLVTANAGPAGVDGVSYLVFVAPALIVTAAVTIASGEFTYPVMQGFKWNPTYIGMNAAPLSARQIIDGVVLFVGLRMLTASVVYFAIMAAFGASPSPAAALTVLIATLGGLAFGTPLLAYSATLREDRGQFAVVQRVIVLPLTLFSGTIFPLAQLPWFLQWIGWLSPLWHASELGRVVSYGAERPGWLVAVHVGYLVLLAVAGWLLAVRIATRRLDA